MSYCSLDKAYNNFNTKYEVMQEIKDNDRINLINNVNNNREYINQDDSYYNMQGDYINTAKRKKTKKSRLINLINKIVRKYNNLHKNKQKKNTTLEISHDDIKKFIVYFLIIFIVLMLINILFS